MGDLVCLFIDQIQIMLRSRPFLQWLSLGIIYRQTDRQTDTHTYECLFVKESVCLFTCGRDTHRDRVTRVSCLIFGLLLPSVGFSGHVWTSGCYQQHLSAVNVEIVSGRFCYESWRITVSIGNEPASPLHLQHTCTATHTH